MVRVSTCPKNQTEVDKASNRLGCGSDKYGNNQYMCLPNVEKTSLYELCYDGVMGIQHKGTCLELNITNKKHDIIAKSCANFSYGCPEDNYWNHQILKYPACQSINQKHGCYAFHTLCPPMSNESKFNSMIDDDNEVLYCTIAVFAIILFIIAIPVVIWKWKNSKTKNNKRPDSDPNEDDSTKLNEINTEFDPTEDDSTKLNEDETESLSSVTLRPRDNTEDHSSKVNVLDRQSTGPRTSAISGISTKSSYHSCLNTLGK